MDARVEERLRRAADKIATAAKEWFEDLVIGDDRPPNWNVFMKVVDKRRWRRLNEQAARDVGEDSKDQT